MFVTFFVGKEKAKKRSRLWTGLRMTWTSSGRKMQSRQENSADSVRGKGRPPAMGCLPSVLALLTPTLGQSQISADTRHPADA